MRRANALLGVLALAITCALPALAYASADGTRSATCNQCHTPELNPAVNRRGPHGGFTNATNRCSICHTVHVAPVGSSDLLEGASKTSNVAHLAHSADDICMTCHDGTQGRGVYGAVAARGLAVGGGHRALPPTTAVVPGGDPAGGSRNETDYEGSGGFLSCVDCHTVHGTNMVAEYATERERIYGINTSTYKVQSTNLLKQRPNGSDTTSTEYGSDWCAGCHRGRHAGGGAVNHPVDSTYTYDNVPLAPWPGPVELAADGAGNIFVADPGNRRIQRFTTAGGYLGQWNSGVGGVFTDPRGVVVKGGEVLVSDPKRGWVSRFNASGTFLGGLAGSGPTDRTGTQWSSVTPAGLGTNVSGTALVEADIEGSGVLLRTAFPADPTFTVKNLSGNPFPGTAVGQLNVPTDAAVDSVGAVFVVDSMNKRIVKYTATAGSPVSVVPTAFVTTGLERPISIAIDASDRVYIADAGNHMVYRYLANGTLQASFGGLGSDNGQFRAPRGVALDAAGNIYVVDSGNSRVQKLASDGSFVTAWGTRGTGNGQFDFNPVTMGPLAAESSRDPGGLGLGAVYGGLGYVMQEPREAAQVGHYPICQQCHEDSRYAGGVYDGVALGGVAITVPDGGLNTTWGSKLIAGVWVNYGPRDVATPRFQNFPHETVNAKMVVETNDDLCVNCHSPARLP